MQYFFSDLEVDKESSVMYAVRRRHTLSTCTWEWFIKYIQHSFFIDFFIEMDAAYGFFVHIFIWLCNNKHVVKVWTLCLLFCSIIPLRYSSHKRPKNNNLIASCFQNFKVLSPWGAPKWNCLLSLATHYKVPNLYIAQINSRVVFPIQNVKVFRP